MATVGYVIELVSGGLAMLRMMAGSPDGRGHDHMDARASHTD